MNTKYYWGDTCYNSYKELLIALKKCYGVRETGWYWNTRVVDTSYQDFSSCYSHNDNDGIYHKGRNERRSRPYTRRNENGEWESGREDYYVWIEPSFEAKTLRIVDSYGRILNSKDLWKDWQEVTIPEKPSYYYSRGCWSRAKWQKGHGWRKYRGDHGGLTNEKRETEYHESCRNALIETYGTTFKLRSKRSEVFPDRWEQWERDRGGRRSKGWKRTRKKKQWM